ncbi:hypothetical protein BLAT2472_50123 [Burkholderia latens]
MTGLVHSLALLFAARRRQARGSGATFIAWLRASWAVLSVLTGLVIHTWQLLTLRFMLGVAEGGMLPVVLTMVSQWFPDRERGRATGPWHRRSRAAPPDDRRRTRARTRIARRTARQSRTVALSAPRLHRRIGNGSERKHDLASVKPFCVSTPRRRMRRRAPPRHGVHR